MILWAFLHINIIPEMANKPEICGLYINIIDKCINDA
jgi:hypothetical protein